MGSFSEFCSWYFFTAQPTFILFLKHTVMKCSGELPNHCGQNKHCVLQLCASLKKRGEKIVLSLLQCSPLRCFVRITQLPATVYIVAIAGQ